MSNYFDTNNKKDCSGCCVCALKCPQHAITMQQDSEGFLYPVVDKEKCINCNLCKNICPNKDYPQNEGIKAYIAINKDNDELMNSSSGGCFLPIAKYIIAKNGIVFGAAYDNNLVVKHIYTDKESGLTKFQGSKYVRSDLNNSYVKVKEFLSDDKYVLFSGTPCQCQGLRTYLGKEYEKLFTCEIICHATPSPKVFEFYKKYLENKKGKKVVDIKFRAKSNGWRNQIPIIVYEDEEKEEEIYFYNAFISELLNRPSCHNCHFCTSNRLSDFTIGDAWGINEIDKTVKDNNTGISLLCVNTPKGNNIMEYLNTKLELKQANIELAFQFNHNKNVLPNKNREAFFDGISSGIINESNILDYMVKYTKKPLYKVIINKMKIILKTILKMK